MNKLGFKLEKIKTEQFAIIEDSYDDSNEETGLKAKAAFGASPKNSAIISIIKFKFQHNQKTFLIIEVSCKFSIEEAIWTEFSKEKKVHIPKGFLAQLAIITIGTTRGIIHAKTGNTKLNGFILPTVDVTEIITEDGIFDK